MNQKDALLLSITTFITIVMWIGFSVYHASVTSTIPESLQKRVEPIDARFDTETVDKLKKREKIMPVAQISEEEATATPTLSPAPIATQSATQSGGLQLP